LLHSTDLRAEVAILTGGRDRPYALGLADALIAEELTFDFIGSDELASPDLERSPQVRVLNLRGDVSSQASLPAKVLRIASYYAKLIRYAATAEPKVFHILWNNRVEFFDRTFLLLYYRLLGKRVLHTVHNVNIRRRDGKDSWLNRSTLRAQYRLTDHLFVHTQQMKRELIEEFGVAPLKISVIPFGINDTVPKSVLTKDAARERLGISNTERVILFFGNIAPYKGVEYLVEACARASEVVPELKLIIAGRIKNAESYWRGIRRRVEELGLSGCILERIEFVPDAEAEIYFKAADVLALPYTHVFQSGVLFLSYSFGLPVIASDVGSLREDIIEGETGFVCAPRDSEDLGNQIRRYFDSDLYRSLESRRDSIRRFAMERYSWAKVGAILKDVYRR
jgi:glycosyltransferase involved in cell wall biosynthesis